MAWEWMLRYMHGKKCYYGLGMDAPVIGLHSNFDVSIYGLSMDAPVLGFAPTWTLFWFGHGCSGTVIIVCTGEKDVIML